MSEKQTPNRKDQVRNLAFIVAATVAQLIFIVALGFLFVFVL
jgi:hypothetical protein